MHCIFQLIQSKKVEIENGKFTCPKSSERIRSKRLRGATTLSAVTAALQGEETETDDGEQEEQNEDVS